MKSLWSKVDAVLLTSSHNLRYFTGFSGGEGAALLFPNQKYLFVDARYTESAKIETKNCEVIEFTAGKRNDKINQYLQTAKMIGYEDASMTVAEFLELKKINESCEWTALSQELSLLRMVKTDEEIQYLKEAEEIGLLAFQEVLPLIKIGVSELEVAAELEYRMRKHGAEGISFSTIVVSGYKSSFPHGMPSEKKIENGDFVTMDFGCIYHGYCSDMTRTIAVGSITKEQKKIYQTVQRAQEEGLHAICSGIKGKDVDATARRVIEKEGYGKFFGHSLGHGVGLLIHEFPNLSPKSETELKPNMIVTCEPGIYIPDFGGVRIEDMVCVKEDGIDNFTQLSKDLLIIG